MSQLAPNAERILPCSFAQGGRCFLTDFSHEFNQLSNNANMSIKRRKDGGQFGLKIFAHVAERCMAQAAAFTHAQTSRMIGYKNTHLV